MTILSHIFYPFLSTCVYIHRSNAFNGFVFSTACPGKMNPWDMLVVTNEFFFSDWLFLYYLAKNMEPYLFRQMLLEHIIPEVQSERNSLIYGHETDDESGESNEKEKMSESDSDDDESLHSDDMENAPTSRLMAVNEKRVKFV